MRGGSLFLVVIGLLALFVATTGRYACFEQFIVGLFTGQCNPTTTNSNTGVTGGLFGGGLVPGFGDRPILNFPNFGDLFPGLPSGLPGFPISPFDPGGFTNIQLPKNTGVTGGIKK